MSRQPLINRNANFNQRIPNGHSPTPWPNRQSNYDSYSFAPIHCNHSEHNTQSFKIPDLQTKHQNYCPKTPEHSKVFKAIHQNKSMIYLHTACIITVPKSAINGLFSLKG